MRSLLFSLMLSFLPSFIYAQSTQLIENLNGISQLLKEIETGKEVHTQAISFDEENPYRVVFSKTTTNLKNGKSEEKTSEFHIGFLDKNQVRIKTSKNEMQVILGSGKDDLIEIFEEEKSKGYKDKLHILCDDIDNAREIEKAFKTIIPLADDAWEQQNQLPTDFIGLFSFIEKNINSIEYDAENKVEQSIAKNAENKDRVTFLVEEFDKKGMKSKSESTFSLGDLNASKVRLSIKKQKVALELSIRSGLKYITTINEKEEEEFVEKGILFFETPEQAILIKRAFEKLIPLAKKEIDLRTPKSSSIEEAKKKFQTFLKRVEIKDKVIKQDLSFEGRQATLNISVEKDGKSLEDKRIFDFSDFSDTPDSDIDKNSMTVTIKTNGGKKYVQLFENSEQENYEKKVVFYAPDVETHRQMMVILPIILRENANKITPEKFDWLSVEAEKITEISSELTQNFKKVNPNEPCKIQLKSTENKGKKEEELLSEFNLYDINPRSIEMDVKGKNVFVKGETIGKDEIIQQYKNNGKLTYQKSFQIPVRNIVIGKKFSASLRSLIEGCKQ